MSQVTMGSHTTLGQQLDEISDRMDAAYAAWSAGGHPSEGPEHEAREQGYADLRALTEHMQLHQTTAPGKCPLCGA